jgi:uncharacterized protein YhjY with autotransporter beta-barrel domain
MYLCIATVHPHAKATINPYSLDNLATSWTQTEWTKFGGSDMDNTKNYLSRMSVGDQLLYLMYKYPRITTGFQLNYYFL